MANMLPILDEGMVLRDERNTMITLESIYCPVCGKGESTSGPKTKVASLASNVTCKRCRKTNASKLWLCGCNEPWPKCKVHRRPITRVKAVPLHKVRRRKLVLKYGTDKPIPRRRDLAGNEPASSDFSSQGFQHANKT